MQTSKDDTLPHNICNHCLDKLIQSYTFQKLCCETQQKLQKLYGSTSDKPVYYYSSDHDDNEDGSNIITVSDATDAATATIDDNDVCNNKILTETAETINNNIDDVDTKLSTYSCKLCGKFYSSKYSLNRHMKVHLDDALLKCSICFKKFSRTADVKRHMSRHTGIKPYSCVVCQATFTQSGSLAQHLRKHNDFKIVSSIKKPRIVESKPHLCSMCGKRFKYSCALTIHIRRHVGDKPFRCKTCDMG